MAQKSIETITQDAELSTQELRLADFRANGLSISDWASKHGFSTPLVYAVLRGERKCLRGQSFEIARTLGMKK